MTTVGKLMHSVCGQGSDHLKRAIKLLKRIWNFDMHG